MNRERIALLLHNARNRLASLCPGATPAQAAEMLGIAGQLSSAMALLRLEGTGPGLHREEVDLEVFFSDLMAEAARLSPAALATEGEADFSGSPFGSWVFDSQLIRVVLMDGLMNAWRHARTKVRLEAGCQGGELRFVIRDDGPGFPPAWLAAAGPGDAARPKARGTGLGLELARHIAGMHGTGPRTGRVELANETEHGGARLSIFLP